MTRTFRLLRRLPRWVRSGLREGVETVRFLSGVVAIWFAWSSIAFATYYIPSESMQPTLEVGDRIIVSKWAYGYSRHSLPLGLGGLLPDSWDGRVGWAEPERGDVIVLQSPREDLVLIKRVVGVPGDRIEVRDGRLIINGDMVLRAQTEARRYRQHNGFPPWWMSWRSRKNCPVRRRTGSTNAQIVIPWMISVRSWCQPTMSS